MISIAHIFAPYLSFLTGAGSLGQVAGQTASASSCLPSRAKVVRIARIITKPRKIAERILGAIGLRIRVPTRAFSDWVPGPFSSPGWSDTGQGVSQDLGSWA